MSSPVHQLDRLRRERAERHRLATTLAERVADREFYATNPDAVRWTLSAVVEEPARYARRLEEPMPAHLNAAPARARLLVVCRQATARPNRPGARVRRVLRSVATLGARPR